MWEKITKYKLSLKKNLIYEFCQEAYKESSNFDVFFITSDKFSIPAHRIILALTSELIKSLESDDLVQIMLPDYSKSVVEGFVQFLYSGEALIDFNERKDFISLCNLMMVNVPGLCSNPEQETDENISDEALLQQLEDETMQNYSVSDNEVSIETPEIEHIELLEGMDIKQEETELEPVIQKHYLKVPDNLPHPENNKDQKNALHKPNSRKNSDNSKETEPCSCSCMPGNLPTWREKTSESKLQKAINAVQLRRMSTQEAARKYRIPKSTLYRKLKEAKT